MDVVGLRYLILCVPLETIKEMIGSLLMYEYRSVVPVHTPRINKELVENGYSDSDISKLVKKIL